MFRDIILEAKDVWKGYEGKDGIYRWVLSGINLEVARGDFIAVLGGENTGRTALLDILSFNTIPDRGELRFEGRLISGRNNELIKLRKERIILLDGSRRGYESTCLTERLAVVLVDNPDKKVLEELRTLTQSDKALVAATTNVQIAEQAGMIYRLKEGNLLKLSGIF